MNRGASRMAQAWLLALALIGSLSACSTNPQTGRREVLIISEEEELAIDEQEARAIESSIGLVEYPALAAYVDALGFMAYALMQQKKYNAAIEYLQTAVRIAPDSFVAHDRLAIAYEQSGRFDEAIDELQRAAELADRQQRPEFGRMFRGRIEALNAKRTRP